jgi:hypothetical protein
MSLCPSTTIALFCNAAALFHNLSSLTGVGLACGAGACLFGDGAGAAPPRDRDAAAGKAGATRQKRMKTRGNLFIVGSYF